MRVVGKPRTDKSGLFLYEGKTLEEWLPSVAKRVVERFDPLKVVLFGSLARGEANYDSDIDLLVVFDHVKWEDKRELAIQVRLAMLDVPAPIDISVTGPDEIGRRGDMVGSILRPALREGEVLYERKH
jgi:predicted nucleotidyltransferase